MALLGRDTLVIGPAKDPLFLLESFHGKEALGTPYRYDLSLLSDEPNIPVNDVLGKSLTVRLTLDSGQYRFFDGVVTYFAKTGLAVRHTRYAVVLNPKLSLFDYTRNYRIFNDASNFKLDPEDKPPSQDTVKIVTQVLADRDFTNVDAKKLQHTPFHDRRYCVQYRETDLNFVQRLLEEEGIYYFFRHDEGQHAMVLADSFSAHDEVPGYETVPYLPAGSQQGGNRGRDEECFWELSVAGSLFTGKHSVRRGYDYAQKRPKEPQIKDSASMVPAPGAKFEEYDYTGGLSEETPADTETKVRLQADVTAHTTIDVEGSTMGLGVGHLVKLVNPLPGVQANPFWSDEDYQKTYLITSATYAFSVNQYETADLATDEPFRAHYTLLDSQVQFRPQRTALKPRIEGPQTAIVVGGPNDEIYTDRFGRVKVQFDWDRKPERDEESSCWVRVAHVWAGKQWGAIHIPRVGQEVIVEFLDGDPDRPIITGRVYNTDNMPPYTLPQNQTQSGIKSRSSKGGTDNNFNEIRFEDLKGKEELHMQAERDMSTLVKRNQSTSVGADRSVSVGGNHSVSVTGTQTTTVTKDETQTYKAKRTMKVTETNDDEVTGAHTGKYHGGRTETVEKNDKVEVTSIRKVLVHGLYDIEVDTEYKAVQKTNSIAMKGDKLTVNNGKCEVHLEGANATVTAEASLTLQCGGASITLKKDGTIEVTGSTKVALSGGGSTVGLEKAGATMAGMKVGVSGNAITEITGALIKIN